MAKIKASELPFLKGLPFGPYRSGLKIVAVKHIGAYPVEEFIENEMRSEDLAKLAAILNMVDAVGPHYSHEQKFKKVFDCESAIGKLAIHELKPGASRICCFWQPDKTLCLTHGFKKDGQKMPRTEREMALRIAKGYLEAQAS